MLTQVYQIPMEPKIVFLGYQNWGAEVYNLFDGILLRHSIYIGDTNVRKSSAPSKAW